MGRILGNRFRRHLVKGLHVNKPADKPLLMQFDHVRRDAAQGEGSLDAPVQHFLADVLDNGQRSAAGTRLDAEAVLEVTGVNHHFGSLFREHNVPWVLGVADGAGRDFGAVPYAVHNHHGLHVRAADAGRQVGIRYQVVRNHHYMFGVAGIRKGITQ